MFFCNTTRAQHERSTNLPSRSRDSLSIDPRFLPFLHHYHYHYIHVFFFLHCYSYCYDYCSQHLGHRQHRLSSLVALSLSFPFSLSRNFKRTFCTTTIFTCRPFVNKYFKTRRCFCRFGNCNKLDFGYLRVFKMLDLVVRNLFLVAKFRYNIWEFSKRFQNSETIYSCLLLLRRVGIGVRF